MEFACRDLFEPARDIGVVRSAETRTTGILESIVVKGHIGEIDIADFGITIPFAISSKLEERYNK